MTDEGHDHAGPEHRDPARIHRARPARADQLAELRGDPGGGEQGAVARLRRPARDAARGVVVDFGDAVLLDAAGLVLLARAETRARLLGCTLRAVVPALSAHVRRALHLTGLARLVPVFADVASATAAPVPAGAGGEADTTHVLDAIRALHPGTPGSPRRRPRRQS